MLEVDPREDLARAEGRRARRARPHPPRRDRHRRDPQARRAATRLQAARAQGHRRSPRTSATSCAAPIRFPTTWSTRAISATARPSTCSTAATAPWSRCRAGSFVPIPFAQMLDPADRPHARPHGRHPLGPLRDRAALHDPPAPRRLRGPARAGQVRRHRRDVASRSSAAQFEYLVGDRAAAAATSGRSARSSDRCAAGRIC